MLGEVMSNIHWLDFNDAAEQTPEESFEVRRERLRRALIGQLSSVLHHLFPSGKILGGAVIYNQGKITNSI